MGASRGYDILGLLRIRTLVCYATESIASGGVGGDKDPTVADRALAPRPPVQ